MLFWALLLGGLAVVLVYVVPHYVALGVAASVAVVLLRILLDQDTSGVPLSITYLKTSPGTEGSLAIIRSTIALGLLRLRCFHYLRQFLAQRRWGGEPHIGSPLLP